MNEDPPLTNGENHNHFPLVRRPSGAVEKAAPGAKRILAGMVAETIALAETKAAERGDADAQCRLGYRYEWGDGVPADHSVAVKWYRKAVEQDHVQAQFRLGRCFKMGWGVNKNVTEAVKWFRKAAEQKHPKSQRHLGACYENGDGVPQNYTEAVKWYRKAAEQGDADAKELLGLCYINGNGVNKDAAEAYHWFKLAEEEAVDEAVNKSVDEACKELGLSPTKLSMMSPEQIQEVTHRYRLAHKLDILKSDR